MTAYRDGKWLQPLSVVLLLPVFMLVTSDAEICGMTDHMSSLQVFLDTDPKTPHGDQPIQAFGSVPRVLAMLQAAGQTADQATAYAVAKFGADADQFVGSEEMEFMSVENHKASNFANAVFGGIAVAFIVAFYVWQKGAAPSGSDEDSDDHEEVEQRSFEPLDEDAYRAAMVLIIRDGQFLAKGQGASMLRVTRILGHVALLAATIITQIILLNQIKFLVTPQAVTTIRTAYDHYELKMCGGVENHTTLTINGKHRCKPQYFQPELFMGLDDELKADVCNIPFSQLRFFKLVLLIWGLTCIGQMKMCIETFATVMFATPTCESMVTAVISMEEAEHQQSLSRQISEGSVPIDVLHQSLAKEISQGDGRQGVETVIQALTSPMKAIIFFTVLLPWFVISCNLLAQGSRWLAATNDFGDLILNAVGLEFVLLLKDLVYHTIITERNKRELRNTRVHPMVKKESAGFLVFMGGFIWGALAWAWVYAYIFHLQTVLPEYKWDVHASCTRWLQSLRVKPNLTALRAAGLGSL